MIYSGLFTPHQKSINKIMISTLYLMQFIAFYCLQATSKYTRQEHFFTMPILAKAFSNKALIRGLAIALLLSASIGFVVKMGLMSGICGFILGLMGVGCLCVLLMPFRYIRLQGVAILYICSVALEKFI
jgi:hypothetical protein